MHTPNKRCKICGKSYYYCPSCNEKRDPAIYSMFDCEECKIAFDILVKETLQRITTEEAKNRLKELGFSKDSPISESERNHFTRVINYTIKTQIVEEEKNKNIIISTDKEEKVEPILKDSVNENIESEPIRILVPIRKKKKEK